MFRKKQKEPKIELYELWSLWEADLWKMQKAFADYAALDRPAECPEEKRKEIREGMQLFIDKYDALWYFTITVSLIQNIDNCVAYVQHFI